MVFDFTSLAELFTCVLFVLAKKLCRSECTGDIGGEASFNEEYGFDDVVNSS